MRHAALKIAAGATVVLLVTLLYTGCCGRKGQERNVFDNIAKDDIVTYNFVDMDKRIITVGKYDSFDEAPLERALEAKFPELDIVFAEMLAGPYPFTYMALQNEQGELPDLLFCKLDAEENDFLYDLAAEGFLSRYNLSSLDSLNIDGQLFQLPTINSVQGIVYNKTLFDAHGWEPPCALDEFYSLCEEIKAEGIRPFAACTKYIEQIEWLGLGFSYDEVLSDLEKQLHYNEFVQRKASCEGLLEPAFEVLKDFYEKGLLTEADFSSSITQYGYDLLSGKTAMMPRNLDILRLPQEEGVDCELGFISFPTEEPGQGWMQMIGGTKLSVSKKSMEDAQHRKDILDILDYISTNEGQKVLQEMFYGISSLTSYQQESAFEFQEIQECVKNGRILYTKTYGSDSDVNVFHEWCMGRLNMEEIIQANDSFESFNELELLGETPIGTASEKFNVLETSIYHADKMREKTGAQIALMLNRYYFKGNMASIYQGDIVYPERFILKGVKGDDALTTYEITGANLRALMEHPIINGAEVNAMYAPAGLKMVYAPWADLNENVRSLTLEDGSPLADEELYTIAAWEGAIDSSYISNTVRTYEELGTNQELMTKAIQESREIQPAGDGRVTLEWDIER